MIAVTAEHVLRFRSILADRLGLHFDDSQLRFLEGVLRNRLDAGRAGCETYLRGLEVTPPSEELGAIASAVTVGETYFYRNLEQFQAFRDIVLPARMRARSEVKRLRILSAGCASGEEPYTLAMVCREAITDPAWSIEIAGIDINPDVLVKAARGEFSQWSLRETPDDARRRWFIGRGRDVSVDPVIRRSVSFHAGNLADDDLFLLQPEAWDVVFFRNVMMYFTPAGMRQAIGRLQRTLAPGGYLFLGHAETLRTLSSDFHLHHTHRTFYYQRRFAHERGGDIEATVEHVAEPAAAREHSSDWATSIHAASERVRVLTSAVADQGESTSALRPESRDLTPLFELLHEERFDAAMQQLDEFADGEVADPDVLLMSAVLLTHKGCFARSEEVCRRLLEIDEFNAGAHYVLALCRESASDRQGAVDHAQVAAYLDPGFAMPRLHLGLLARRSGDRESARRELGQALGLLEREDPSRVLLFGGGFKRPALVALCRAELAAAGAAS